MKKILLIVLTLALMLSLCAGCNNSRIDDDYDDKPITDAISGVSDNDADDILDDDSSVDTDQPHIDTPDGWPIELPFYPGGEADVIYRGETGSYSITIYNTSEATMEKYAKAMINAGWKCTEAYDDFMWFDNGEYGATLLLLNRETLSIYMDKLFEMQEQPKVWPAGRLPQGFPEYPDGDIFNVLINIDTYYMPVALYIGIEESSKETFGNYKATLKDAGWKLEDFGEERIQGDAGYLDYECWSIEKEGVSGLIQFYNPWGVVIIEIY